MPEAAQTHSLLTAGQGGQNLLCPHPRAHFCGCSDQTSAKPCLPHVFSHTLRRVVLSSSFQSHQARQKSLLRQVLACEAFRRMIASHFPDVSVMIGTAQWVCFFSPTCIVSGESPDRLVRKGRRYCCFNPHLADRKLIQRRKVTCPGSLSRNVKCIS